MASSTKAPLLCLQLAMLLHSSLGATLNAHDKSEKLMRSESWGQPERGKIVEFTSDGTKVHTIDEVAAKQWASTGLQLRHRDAPTPDTMPVECDQDMAGGCCLFDFVRGTENSDSCDTRAWTNTSFMTEAMCEFAATQAGAIIENNDFIEHDWHKQKTAPLGCYMRSCVHRIHGTLHWCYFYNPSPGRTGDDRINAPNISGQPVCHRAKYINGTSVANSDWTDNAMCHDKTEYEVINNRSQCILARECMGECGIGQATGGSYEILDFSEQLQYPPGCFMEHRTRRIGSGDVPCVYWNPADYQFADSTIPRVATPPHDPVGWPLCKVTTPQAVPTTAPVSR